MGRQAGSQRCPSDGIGRQEESCDGAAGNVRKWIGGSVNAQAERVRRALDRAARSFRRWGLSRATSTNEARFEAAQRRLHKAAERYALFAVEGTERKG